MPCVRGNQLSIEERREKHRQQKEDERAFRASPEYQYWQKLVDRVYKTPTGFDSLQHGDRLFYLLNVLSGEVHNGGFDQFFSNSSGDHCAETIAALSEVGANESLRLLLQAKATLFGNADVPANRAARCERMPTMSAADEDDCQEVNSALDVLDKKFWEDPDNFGGILDRIAIAYGLYLKDK
jgi:hypothetical protein